MASPTKKHYLKFPNF